MSDSGPAVIYQGAPGPNQGGVGYVSQYNDVSGKVPIGADPDDGEHLMDARSVVVWVEITHTSDD